MLSTSKKEKLSLCNNGEMWTDFEETILLEELDNNIDTKIIAQQHGRTIGSINARRRQIAYKMYLKNVPFDEISKQTKLDNNSIMETIKRRLLYKSNKQSSSINNIELQNMKNDITLIKNTLSELVEMMKAVYEFEDT